jgi:hypothetical protein
MNSKPSISDGGVCVREKVSATRYVCTRIRVGKYWNGQDYPIAQFSPLGVVGYTTVITATTAALILSKGRKVSSFNSWHRGTKGCFKVRMSFLIALETLILTIPAGILKNVEFHDGLKPVFCAADINRVHGIKGLT